MSPTLFLGRTHCLRQSLPLTRSTPLASSSAPSRACPPDLQFAVQYLVHSCGLSSDEALKASKHIKHLKSPENADGVLRFLREIGVSEVDIRSAVAVDARILCSSLENNWKPLVAKLQGIGLSMNDISAIVSRRPYLFRHNFAPKVDFWMRTLGLTGFMSVVMKCDASLLCSSLDNVLVPNLSFLTDECGLSPRQIIRLMKSSPRLFSYRPDNLRKQAVRAENLGVERSSGAFLYALIVVSYLNQSTVDARLNNLKSLGLTEEDVTAIVSKIPLVLSQREEMLGCKIEFLINEFGCDKSYLVQNPSLLTYSLDVRLIPRNLVRRLLKSKGISVADQALATFVKATEEQFLVKFILPYERSVPGLHQAYADACVTKTAAKG